MSLYPFLYICIIPFLIVFLVVRKNRVAFHYTDQFLPILNWILLVYAVYQIRVIVGIIQLFKTIAASAPKDFHWQDFLDLNAIQIIASVILPFFFLFSSFSKSKWFSLGMMLLYLNITEWPEYENWEWFKNIAVVLSWFCFLAGIKWLRVPLSHKK